MALTLLPSISSSPTQIVASGSNTTVYTVPAGKTFTGIVGAQGSGVMTINGKIIYTTTPLSVTLSAGTVVASNTSTGGGVYVIGIEQ